MSESKRTLLKFLATVITVILVLIAVDWLLGQFISTFVKEPPYILRYENVPAVLALWRDADAGIQPIVFTGSSQTYTGISPHQFNDRLKVLANQDIHSVNVSILGSVVTIQRDLIGHLIIPNHPQVILYGVEMRAFLPTAQDASGGFVNDFQNKALGYAISRPSEIERDVSLWLLRHSNLVQYRDNIHDWLTGASMINNVKYTSPVPDDLGFAPFSNAFSKNPSNITSQFIPFSVTDQTRQLTMSIGQICRENHVPCILMNMPLHELSYQYISADEEAQYRSLIQEANLPIWDFNTPACRSLLGDKSFFNLNHLNLSGAATFTTMVADVYSHVFFGTPISGDATCAVLSS